MAIDFEKLKRKLEGTKTPKGWVKFKKDEEKTIRVVPVEDGDPFKTVYMHYNVGNEGGFTCPKKNYNEPCAVCEFASELWKEGTEESKEMAKQMFVRDRHFSPVLVRGEETEGVRWWSYGKEVYEYMINLCLNPDYGDITDLDSGTDITISVTQPKDAKYPKTSCTPKRSSSKFCATMDKKQCAEVLKTVPNLEELIGRKTSAEVKEMLAKKFMIDEKKEPEGKPEVERGGKPPSDEPQGVEDALDELLGDEKK
jgi:hypothetical protein